MSQSTPSISLWPRRFSLFRFRCVFRARNKGRELIYCSDLRSSSSTATRFTTLVLLHVSSHQLYLVLILNLGFKAPSSRLFAPSIMSPDLLQDSPPLSRRSSSSFASSSASNNAASQDVSDLDFHLCFGDSVHPQLDIPPVSPTYAFPETPVTPFQSAFFTAAALDIQTTHSGTFAAEYSPSASSSSGSSSSGSATYSYDSFGSSSSSPSSSSPYSYSGSISPFDLADDYDEKIPLSPVSVRIVSPGTKDLLPEFVLGGTLAAEFGLDHSPMDALDSDAFPISPHSPEVYRPRSVACLHKYILPIDLILTNSGHFPVVGRGDATPASRSIIPVHLSRDRYLLAPPSPSDRARHPLSRALADVASTAVAQ